MHYLGIDWATDKHDLCLLNAEGQILSQFEIPHSMNGFKVLQDLLCNLDDTQINIERSDGLLVDWLIQQDCQLYITPPHILASRRPSRVKDDRSDAFLLAYLLRLDEPECRPYNGQSKIVVHLRQLLYHYTRILTEQTRLNNQLISGLKQYYPVVLALFTKSNSPLSLAFLERYPTPQQAEALTMDDLATFLQEHSYRYMDRLELLYKRLQQPMPHARVQDGHVEQVKMIIPLLRMLHKQRHSMIKQIQTVFQSHPEAEWWLSFPGTSGPLTPAGLLAWIGDNRQRFPTASALQANAGTVPVTRRSGKSRSVHFRRVCNHPLRRATDIFARQSRRDSGWARAYFYQQLERGHSISRANRALANRWMKIIWTLWQRRETYDEAIHVANRSRKGQSANLAQVG